MHDAKSTYFVLEHFFVLCLFLSMNIIEIIMRILQYIV